MICNVEELDEEVRRNLSLGWSFWRPKAKEANFAAAESAFRVAVASDSSGAANFFLGDFLLARGRTKDGLACLQLSERQGFSPAFLRTLRYNYHLSDGEKKYMLTEGQQQRLNELAGEDFIVAKVLLVQYGIGYDGVFGWARMALNGIKCLLEYRLRMRRSGRRNFKNLG